MPEENKNVKDVVHPEAGTNASDTQPPITEKPKEDSQDKNWKEVRDKMKRLEERNNLLEREITSFKPQSAPKEQDALDALEDDDIVTVRDVKKMVSKYAQSAAKDLISKREKEREIEETPSKYNDYFEVVKYADEFEKENPAAAQAIHNAPNPRAAGYQIIKNWLQIKEKISEPSQIAEKAEENAKKPISSQAVGTTSPLNDVRKYEKMTSKRAEEIQALAQEYASRR